MSQTWASCARRSKPCVGWVEKYFKDCLCSSQDDISFTLGMLSLVFWAVAEIPQLLTNFNNKSAQGVSLTFLFTWVVGDVFNLVGCLLEPATLPTQLYTAILYTAVTVILVLQILYYDYFLKWWKHRAFHKHQQVEKEEDNKDKDSDSTKDQNPSIPISTPNPLRVRRDLFYTSARSLAKSATPPSSSSYLRVGMGGRATTKSGLPVAALLAHDLSSDDEEEERCGPLTRSSRRTMSRSAGYRTFLAGSLSLPASVNAVMEGHMLLLGRKLLQETEPKSNPYGLWLGWIMAAIYMGGRVPQIYLNIKRGSVEGLNPLMFLFALIANATYVGSILVRSVEWARIKSNAPWLLDAIGCVFLDLFILVQYGYYKYKYRGRASQEDVSGDCPDAEKPLLA